MNTFKPDELADNSLEDIVGGSGQWIAKQKDPGKKSDLGKKPTGFSKSKETGDGENLFPGSPPNQTSGSKNL